MKKLLLAACILLAADLAAQQAPEPQFRIKGAEPISILPGGEVSLSAEVVLPEKTHIYVRHVSALSFNILTSFAAAPGSGFRVDAVPPAGIIKDQDYILEGRGANPAGEFKLKVFETRGRAPGQTDLPLVIKTQMCNTQTNLCYRPQEIRRTVRIRVEGTRQVSNERAASKVQWVTGYDQALQKARSTGQNIFVLITAPSWCGYCKQLERDVMSRDSVAAVLNGKFIPLQVLDTSPDVRRFSADGFPTMLAYSAQGKQIAELGGRDEQSFLASVRPYERAPSGKIDPGPEAGSESYGYTVSLRGTFVRTGESWTEKTDGKPDNTYVEQRRDANYIVLKNVKTGEFVALPVKGGQGFVFRDNAWQPAMQVNPPK